MNVRGAAVYVRARSANRSVQPQRQARHASLRWAVGDCGGAVGGAITRYKRRMFPAISQPPGRRLCCRCCHEYRGIAAMMRSNNMRLEAEIIQNVLQHQILYNPKHPEAKKRRIVDKVWDQVAETMEMPGKFCSPRYIYASFATYWFVVGCC